MRKTICLRKCEVSVKRLSVCNIIGNLAEHGIHWSHTFVSPSADTRGAVVSYWRKNEVLVNRLGGLSLPKKSVDRLTDRPDMTVDVFCGRNTTA